MNSKSSIVVPRSTKMTITKEINGCHKWKLSHIQARIDVSGWDLNFSSRYLFAPLSCIIQRLTWPLFRRTPSPVAVPYQVSMNTLSRSEPCQFPPASRTDRTLSICQYPGSLWVSNLDQVSCLSLTFPSEGLILILFLGLTGSTEQSPRMSDAFTLEHHETTEYPQFVQGETQIKEDLADAMRESPAVSHDLPGECPKSFTLWYFCKFFLLVFGCNLHT